MFDSPNTAPVFRRAVSFRSRTSAFTLIELLAVIAIIAILAGITFGIVKGVNEKAARSQAQAELATLSVALEAYKRQYGDYPQVTTGAEFLQAAIGKVGPTGHAMDRPALVDVGRFSMSDDPLTSTSATLLDPWGRGYRYYYFTKGSGTPVLLRGYVLFSVGPDSKFTAPTTSGTSGGDAKLTDGNNSDNIYANR